MAKYVDNEAFYAQLKEYLQQCEEADKQGQPQPMIPEVIGEAFLKIAKGLASSYRFSQYSYNDEMVGDAVEDCLIKIRNFDYVQYKNPFAYFTQICWFSFLGTDSVEHKQKKIIYRACENLSLEDFNLDGEDVDMKNQYLEFIRDNIDQREFDRIKQQQGEKKFVHRMKTKKPQAKTEITVEQEHQSTSKAMPLSFD